MNRTGFYSGIIGIFLYLTLPVAVIAAPSLQVDEVLKRSAEHLPVILRARAGVDKQEAALLRAEGAFDRTIDSYNDIRTSGYYDGRSSSITFNQPLKEYNGRLYGQYRISDGEYPSYEGKLDTQSGGEFAVGAIFSLLRDRDIDSRRFALIDEELRLEEAELALELERLNAQLSALLSYWNWLARGLEYHIRNDLWQLAMTRQDALKKEVEAGNKARIFLIENRQNMLKRKSSVKDARRQLENSAQSLSFYYRDMEGKPQVPSINVLPAKVDNGWMLQQRALLENVESQIDTLSEELLALRPDMRRFDLQANRFRRARDLAENQMLPKLDMLTEISKDVGNSELVRDETESRIKLQVSIPLQVRQAEGSIRIAEAELRMIEHERARLQQELLIALETIVNDLLTGEELMQVTAEEMEVAEALLEAERQRFADGASDFFLLNLREETVAESRVRHVQATERYLMAISRFLAVTMQKPALGL